MARPQPEAYWAEPAGSAGITDWESLRHDLESLLRQVENRQLSEDRSADHGPHVAPGHDPDARHRAALRSVKRAVDRFAEPQADHVAPRSDLQSAISEIRAKTESTEPVFHRAPSSAPSYHHVPSGHYSPDGYPTPAQRLDAIHTAYQAPSARLSARPIYPDRTGSEASEATVGGLKRLTAAVTGMTGRLERLEADMRATRDASGDIAEVAQQVSQLTHVVELLAGAVGEQGQVKRLESQIADLARLYSDGPRPEIAALTRRIDELSVTVDRLADFQVQEIGRVAREAQGVAATQGSSMRAIEDGVRSIYDRIDALEHSYAIAPDDLDRLTREMGSVTEALNHSGDSDVLASIAARLDALSDQIVTMGGADDTGVSALRDDVEALRDVIGETLEPRFAALESRLDNLTSKVGNATAPATPSFTQLEEQIRRLAQRMDQTGQQLTGLTELYKSDPGPGAAPDFEALAALVAERTSQEVARLRGDEAGLDEASLGELEKRLSRLFADQHQGEAPSVLADVAQNLTSVDERLDRLESALETLARGTPAPVPSSTNPQPVSGFAAPTRPAEPLSPPPAPAQHSHEKAPQRPTVDTASRPPKPSFSEPDAEPRHQRAAQQTDDMPHAPSIDRPLVDDELKTLVAPVEDWSSIGLEKEQGSPAAPRPKATPSGFDTSKIERPARPKSSLVEDPPGFTPMTELETGLAAETSLEDDQPISDRNTFIAAARRAARGNQDAQTSAESNSLIGRALARFQAKKAVPETGPAPHETDPAPLTDLVELPEETVVEDDFIANPDHRVANETTPDQKTGFLARNRRALLLAGALVATSLLALNLVVQRLTPSEPSTPATAVSESATVPESTGSMIDPTPTGSIDPFIPMTLVEPSPTRQILPSTLTPQQEAQTITLNPTFTHSVPPVEKALPDPAPMPIKLDLPPENVGPLDLRQAAADGDAHAQFEIGAIYTEGSVVPQDFEAAAVWYERAAAQGFAPAQYRLGNLYEHGNGVDKDLDEARLWYSRAAEAGNRMAMHNLAALYASGEMGEQQFAAAAEWFERAADAGMTDSQFNLGMLYARGLGVVQNLETSYKWFALAAEDGDKDAAKARDDIGKSLDSAALNQVKTEIANWHMAPINIPANFAPIGTWAESFDAGQTIADKSVTENVQKALARLGYDPGSIDGVMGPKTTQAITEFERATGMTPTGLVNPRLLAVLGSQPA